MNLYRLGNNTPMNFTARPQDTIGHTRGLSLSDTAPPNGGPRAQVIDTANFQYPMSAFYTPYVDRNGNSHPDHYSARPDPDPTPYPLLVNWAATRAGLNNNNNWNNQAISALTIILGQSRIGQIN